MEFLGIVSSDGIRVDTQTIEEVLSLPRSTSPTEIRSFFGLENYNKMFVEGFHIFHLLLPSLLRRQSSFDGLNLVRIAFRI